MLTPELQKIKTDYERIMLEIRARLHTIDLIGSAKMTTGVRELDYEHIAMTFRKLAELIVFANLISHESEYSAVYHDISTEWNMGRLINKIKKINPFYYPIAWLPVIDEESSEGLAELPETDYMTEEELITMWGKCSDLIHAHNPFKGELDYEPYIASFKEWSRKLYGLLNIHGIALADEIHMVVCALASVGNDNKPEVVIYEMDKETNGLTLLG